jgi:hypothetical protein
MIKCANLSDASKKPNKALQNLGGPSLYKAETANRLGKK